MNSYEDNKIILLQCWHNHWQIRINQMRHFPCLINDGIKHKNKICWWWHWALYIRQAHTIAKYPMKWVIIIILSASNLVLHGKKQAKVLVESIHVLLYKATCGHWGMRVRYSLKGRTSFVEISQLQGKLEIQHRNTYNILSNYVIFHKFQYGKYTINNVSIYF